MHVKTDRQSETRRRSGPSRRGAVRRREAVVIEMTDTGADRAPAGGEDELFDERRLRASGGPNDRVQYTCACGFVWAADVSASVACPRCGASQAW
jgi:rubrerythrin